MYRDPEGAATPTRSHLSKAQHAQPLKVKQGKYILLTLTEMGDENSDQHVSTM